MDDDAYGPVRCEPVHSVEHTVSRDRACGPVDIVGIVCIVSNTCVGAAVCVVHARLGTSDGIRHAGCEHTGGEHVATSSRNASDPSITPAAARSGNAGRYGKRFCRPRGRDACCQHDCRTCIRCVTCCKPDEDAAADRIAARGCQHRSARQGSRRATRRRDRSQHRDCGAEHPAASSDHTQHRCTSGDGRTARSVNAIR